MDYTRARFGFQLRKAVRYLRLYGPARTWAKIRGQYHMRRRYATLPPCRGGGARAHVGLIGCGNYAFSTLAYYLRHTYGPVMRTAMDIDLQRAASLARAYGLHGYTDDAHVLLDDDRIDLVFVASNHASHAEYAIAALEAGKSVHVEKPHVVNQDQLVRLCRALQRSHGRVNLGFNRPNSPLGRRVQAALAIEDGPLMLNWFVAGHEIPPDHWYFDEAEGGRVLGNLCHWTDFVYHLVPAARRFPVRITPTRAAQSDCDIAVTYTFGDGSIAAITFSAKGHTFEGVREVFSAHRGNTLLTLKDFQHLVVETVERKRRYRLAFRDHGHAAQVRRSYRMVRPQRDAPAAAGADVSYVWETGQLFLQTRAALERNSPITVTAFDGTLPAPTAAHAEADNPATRACDETDTAVLSYR